MADVWCAAFAIYRPFSFKTADLGAEINAAFYSQYNGKCGYILKPDLLRKKDQNAKDKEMLASPAKYVFRVTVSFVGSS